ncbi:MAG TPA: imidazole glycerol phosphate synthase cyclase subunit [Candidatus Omnitrophota bacterium]|nr:imidazole glycerol phosphate synthase cyclase subunit [Candidatus Omnitrophota bacterium]HRZ15544.1 imidazole glycerol phosphate synthase cyclase subunit [Candidatus Omnitrophota bacterium]
MSHCIRIIPRLDIKGPNLVKGIHLEGLRVLGTPEQFARYYYENGADELLYMDIVASLYNRNSLHDIIAKTAKETFIPLTVGGGLRSIADMRAVLRAGADRVAFNTAAINEPALITRAAREFGSSTVVISIEAIKQLDGAYLAYTDNGREYTGLEVLQWARRAEQLGAGELLVTSVDREGTGSGFDLELVRMVTDAVSIPVIACGGAGRPLDAVAAVQDGHADAVAVASLLHYHFVQHYIDTIEVSSNREGNREFLASVNRIATNPCASIGQIKECLEAAGLEVRCTAGEESLPR